MVYFKLPFSFSATEKHTTETSISDVRFKVCTAVVMMMFFLVLTPCRMVCRCKRFGETLSPSSRSHLDIF
jgi:hypothetical protein